jgi:nucleoside-diphosphate-sugar epimerase
MGAVRVLVVGATGRLGRVLRVGWAGRADLSPLWQTRGEPPGPGWVAWDPLGAAAMPACDVVVDVAGVTQGARLDDNARLAAAIATAARGRRVLHAGSIAAYGDTGAAAAEDRPLAPRSPYGAAKAAAEAAVAGRAVVMRIGNVIGADALEAAVQAGPVVMDRFPDGQGPRRSCIGPAAFARVVAALVTTTAALPAVINVALPGAVDLAAILRAADVPFAWREARPGAVALAAMDVGRLAAIVPLEPADPAAIAAEWRAFRGRLA